MPRSSEPIDMRLSEADRETVGTPSEKPPPYSYGLTLRLEKPELKKLGMKELPEVGQEYEIIARGRVSNVYESQSEGNRGDRAVSIQVTHLIVS